MAGSHRVPSLGSHKRNSTLGTHRKWAFLVCVARHRGPGNEQNSNSLCSPHTGFLARSPHLTNAPMVPFIPLHSAFALASLLLVPLPKTLMKHDPLESTVPIYETCGALCAPRSENIHEYLIFHDNFVNCLFIFMIISCPAYSYS